MMTDGELVTSYKQAKNHKKQIGVLADLNGCALTEMETKLTALGLIQPTPAPSFDYLRAAELYAEGKSDLEIAEQLGAGKASVARWRKSKDLAANYPKKRTPAVKRPRPGGGSLPRRPAGRCGAKLWRSSRFWHGWRRRV